MTTINVEVYNNKTYQTVYKMDELFDHLKDEADNNRLTVIMPNTDHLFAGLVTNVTKTAESINADVNILDNVQGKVLKALVDAGVKLKYSVSARGAAVMEAGEPIREVLKIDKVFGIRVDAA